jgi:hypothetical protein
MSWNHRVIRYSDGFLQIAEVYYDEKGIPTSYCSASVCGDTPEELEAVLEQHRLAMGKPVLDESLFR